MHVKKGDKVVILAGKDKGATGEILKAMPKENKVLVSGINKMKKHARATKSGQKGQIIEKEMPLHVSNVALAKEKASKKSAK
jgi:large subunit ribosomal protein L24